ncbi:MAG: nucleotide pyrophosphohydrolase [Hahellaceae bacterium]|nr:nucleotide pyrophosphohydrolase [Hahellaceae bacterium]MCP5170062.1 nucleotide pyrophosphohydrolase [Hahellaceae bacterium]
MNESLDIAHWQKVIDEFALERDWDQFHNPKNLAMALTVEASELLQEFQWLTPDAASELEKDPKKWANVQDELADIMVYLLRIADKLNIDLNTALRQKMAKNRQKYPADKVRGSAKKYNEYE